MTFKDLIEFLLSKKKPVIDNIQKNYLEDYYTNSTVYDMNLYAMYNSLILSDFIEDCVKDKKIDLYNNIIKSIILLNDYKYEKLYKTMVLEYNPIWNVDGKTTTVFGDYTIGNKIGENESHTIFGEHTDSQTLGAKTDTIKNVYGEKVNVNGARTSTDTKSVKAFDATSYSDADKNVNAQTEYTDTSESYTDNFTNTSGAATNSTKYGRIENNINNSSRNDIQTYSEHIDSVERQGNIGVTSTQSLIMEERSVALFSFYNIIFNDIMEYITIGVFESED